MQKRINLFIPDELYAILWQEAKDSGKKIPVIMRERIQKSYWQDEILDKIQNMESEK